MDAEKIWNLTAEFNNKFDDKPFLPYQVNLANPAYSTLYENLKWLDEGNQLYPVVGKLWRLSNIPGYEYQPLKENPSWCYGACARPDRVIIFEEIEQYRIKGVYNYDENTTWGQVKAELLTPYVNKVLAHPAVLAHMFFINRLSSGQISFEVLLFCSEKLQLPNIGEYFLHCSAAERIAYCSIEVQNAWKWHYWLYCQIYLNSNFLSDTVRVCSFVCKPTDYAIAQLSKIEDLAELLVEANPNLKGRIQECYEQWLNLFDVFIESHITDSLVTAAEPYNCNFKRFIRFGTDVPGTERDFPTFAIWGLDDIWHRIK